MCWLGKLMMRGGDCEDITCDIAFGGLFFKESHQKCVILFNAWAGEKIHTQIVLEYRRIFQETQEMEHVVNSTELKIKAEDNQGLK